MKTLHISVSPVSSVFFSFLSSSACSFRREPLELTSLSPRALSLGSTCPLCNSVSWGGIKVRHLHSRPTFQPGSQAQHYYQGWQDTSIPFPGLEEISYKRLRWLTGIQEIVHFPLRLVDSCFWDLGGKRREIKGVQIVRKKLLQAR